MATSVHPARPVGDLVREWRQRRGVSQLALALDADVSARHLSFVETGRARPSREMVLKLAERLDVPLRERNALLLAAGFAPLFPERPLDHPALASAREAIERLLAAHEPFPALAIDRHWTLVAANRAVGLLLGGVAPHLLAPPVNVLRLTMHPEGLAPRIANLADWRRHVIDRVRRQSDATADAAVAELLSELEGYPAPPARPSSAPATDARVLVPLELDTPAGRLSLIGTTMVFGTPLDITLSELALEAFFPADATTGERLRRLAAS